MLNQRLQQKLLQKLSPQQIQMIKLLEIPTLQIEERIKKELEENPALEEGEEADDIHSDQEDEEPFEEKDKDQESEAESLKESVHRVMETDHFSNLSAFTGVSLFSLKTRLSTAVRGLS